MSTIEDKNKMSEKLLKDFLDSVTNENTRKSYSRGINLFLQFTGKTVKQILDERKEDLTPKSNEGLVDTKQRATRFEKQYLEPFYQAMLTKGSSLVAETEEPYRPNSAAKNTDGIMRLLSFYSMGFSLRNGSPISAGAKEMGMSRFPLKTEHVRAMFWKERNLMYKLAISLGNDFPARIEDFLSIEVAELPNLDQPTPIEFMRISQKEHQLQKSCLSDLTVSLLKEYLAVYKPKKYLFESTEPVHKTEELKKNPTLYKQLQEQKEREPKPIDQDTLNAELKYLAKEAGIQTKPYNITWHCLRDLVFSTGKTNGIDEDVLKLMLGKAVPRATLPYMKTLDITKPFLKLQESTAINGKILIAENRDILTQLGQEVRALREALEKSNEENNKLREELGFLKGIGDDGKVHWIKPKWLKEKTAI